MLPLGTAQLLRKSRAGGPGQGTGPGPTQHTGLVPTFRAMRSSSDAHFCSHCKSLRCRYLGQQLIFKTPGPILTHLS